MTAQTLEDLSDEVLNIATDVVRIGIKVRMGRADKKMLSEFKEAVRLMQKHFPPLRAKDVVKFSRVIVRVGSTSLRRACGLPVMGFDGEPLP